MSDLNVSLLDCIDDASYQIAKEVKEVFDLWKSGKLYIPKPALRAMGRRYLVLRDRDLTIPELYEFGRLFCFFALVYPAPGDIPSAAAAAVDFYNWAVTSNHSPTEAVVPEFAEF